MLHLANKQLKNLLSAAYNNSFYILLKLEICWINTVFATLPNSPKHVLFGYKTVLLTMFPKRKVKLFKIYILLKLQTIIAQFLQRCKIAQCILFEYKNKSTNRCTIVQNTYKILNKHYCFIKKQVFDQK